jgi:hypothetical protein
MGVEESRRQSRAGRQDSLDLPRHIIEHIGQILRNRTREQLVVPIPSAMLALLDMPQQRTALRSSDRRP